MIFKKKMRTCFKCEQEFQDCYERCPLCYPATKEDFGNLPILIGIGFVILFIVLSFII
jgi:hypothetical protein